jgi:hypothetical protein
MIELVWLIVAGFDQAVLPPGLLRVDAYLSQNGVPVKRMQGGDDLYVTVVGLDALCASSESVQCTVDPSRTGRHADAQVLFASNPSIFANLEGLRSKLNQFQHSDVLIVAVPEDWLLESGVTAAALAMHCGELKLGLDAETLVFQLYCPAAARPGLTMSPESMRKIPEGDDYLRDRAKWFRDKVEKPD